MKKLYNLIVPVILTSCLYGCKTKSDDIPRNPERLIPLPNITQLKQELEDLKKPKSQQENYILIEPEIVIPDEQELSNPSKRNQKIRI